MRRYRLFEWVAAYIVLFGAMLFLLYDKDAAEHHDERHIESSLGGLALVVIFLAFDAYTSTWQSATFDKDTSILSMMLWLSAWSSLFSLLGFLFTSELFASIAFFRRNPSFFAESIILSVTSAVGQLFILMTIKRFGPLTFAALATVRQLASAYISIIVFKHAVHMLQVVGLLLTFAALGAVVRYKLHARAERSSPPAGMGIDAGESGAASRRVEGCSQPGSVDAAPATLGHGDTAALVDGGDGRVPPKAPSLPIRDGELSGAMLDHELESGVSPRGTTVRMRICSTASVLQTSTVVLVSTMVVAVAVIKAILTLLMLTRTQSHDTQGQLQPTGISYSSVSSATTLLWLMILFTMKPACFQPIESSLWPTFVTICVLSVVDLGLTNVAISLLDPALQQCLSGLAPVFTFVAESLLGCELKQPVVILFVVIITAGACVTAASEFAEDASVMKRGQPSSLLFSAVMAAVGASAASACKLVLFRASAIRCKISPIAMLFWVDTFTFLLLTPLSIALGEMYTLIQSLNAASPLLSVGTALTGALGGVRFLTELFALQYMDAVDLSILNTFASLIYVLICFGFVPLPARMHFYVVGATVTFTGLIGYVCAVRYFSPNRLVVGRCGEGCLPPDGPLCIRLARECESTCDSEACDTQSLPHESCCWARWMSRRRRRSK